MTAPKDQVTLDRRNIISLAAGAVLSMRFDYRVCEEEIAYVREYGEYRPMPMLQLQEKELLKEVRLRTIRKCSTQLVEAYTSNGYIINQHLDIYIREIREEQEEILSFFDSLFFAFALPDYEVDICKAAFIESAKNYKKRGPKKRRKRNEATDEEKAGYAPESHSGK